MTSVRQAWRALARRRAYTILTTLTFAAGIAVVTTTFSVVNGVLLKPLPYPGDGQLVSVLESSPGKRERSSLIDLHEPAISDDVRGENCRQPALDIVSFHWINAPSIRANGAC